MPDRIVRDELLTSERYWQCSPRAQVLFLALILSADDAARFTGANFALRTKCMAGTVTHAELEALLAELVTADLIRTYDDGAGRFVFIPRFRNRKRYATASKYPEPPKAINDLSQNKDDSSQTQANPKTAPSQTQDHMRARATGAGVGVGVESDISKIGVTSSRATSKPVDKSKPVVSPPKVNGKAIPANWYKTEEGIQRTAATLNVPAMPGETWADWKTRLFDVLKQKHP